MNLLLSDPAFLSVAATVSGGGGYDADAAAYIARVEGPSGDNQALETAVKDAINAFVVGCKADGIWNAIKASCILAGARTLNGALQPLVGATPTRLGTGEGWDYTRTGGLKGNGTDNEIDTNRSNDADPQDSKHLSFYRTEPPSVSNRPEIVYGSGLTSPGASTLGRVGSSTMAFQVNKAYSSSNNLSTNATITGFCGASRASSSSVSYLYAGLSGSLSYSSETPGSDNLFIYSAPVYTTASDSRLAFYSIGEALDLALLDARVTTLINAFAAAIP